MVGVGAMDFASLHDLLRSTYDEMMPLCAQMSGIAKGIAGLGALFYIALRVWASIARAEPIDVFPLLRPFVLGFCIMFFPTVVLGTMNAVLSPVVQGTEAMVHQQENTLAQLVKRRDKLQEAAYLKNPETAYLVSNEKFDEKIEEMGIIGPEDAVTIAGMYAERAAYQTKQWVMKLFRDFMELLYNAAGLIIDTLRTFILIVLSILGPVVFGISVWDGLPDSGTWYYIVFFLIGIVGYFCVPTVAGWIIEAGGGIGAYGRNVNSVAKSGAQGAYTGGKASAAGMGAAVGNIGGRIKGMLIKGK